MKINLSISYTTTWGQALHICGSMSKLGNFDENHATQMQCVSPSRWELEIEVNEESSFQYYYLVKDGNTTIRREWAKHQLNVIKDKSISILDLWQDIPTQQFLYTSAFTDSIFAHKSKSNIKYYNKTLILQVTCPYVEKHQTLILSGSSALFGKWNIEKALHLHPMDNGQWQINIDASAMEGNTDYKVAIYDSKLKKVIHWEEGENRIIFEPNMRDNNIHIYNILYNHKQLNWRGSGISIPVFSLRTENSFGIGEFSDLKKLVDWANITKQKIIQILPINDTMITHSWTDSYPYNAISTYALHPIYLGLAEYPLGNTELHTQYLQKAKELNILKEVDYEKVLVLKLNYIRSLYAEIGSKTLKYKKYLEFYSENQHWLYPYACFCYLRDNQKTASYDRWGKYSKYDTKKLKALVASSKEIENEIKITFFTQYLLHKQLIEIKEYANEHEVVLKGDIPIGINRNSVEAWVEPHLFNLDVQTGAPPDDFSIDGQNWGFPTYNWSEMAKDGYNWWIKRFRKMADYFDAYRIDHILGFFRIWEIPETSVQGLLGYFSPALPLSIHEIRNWGIEFDEESMTKPYISQNCLKDIFGIYTQEIIDTYLHLAKDIKYELNEFCDNQQKIKSIFKDKIDEKSNILRKGLYSLCNEVLFIKDKRQPHLFHPRISAQNSYSYKNLDEASMSAFDTLYNDYFYNRHSNFWKQEALDKLPILISSTRMLVCGEDLGMIPNCVPSVMSDLQILSLEIERMPKDTNHTFSDISALPFMSVCTTSTHDMSPIRAWWKEDKHLTQRYYNEILWKEGSAPKECTAELCKQILINHLNSPSMWAILPLQDWLSMSDKYRRNNGEEERINIPANPNHYWRYRMHITLEELIDAEDLNTHIKNMTEASERA